MYTERILLSCLWTRQLYPTEGLYLQRYTANDALLSDRQHENVTKMGRPVSILLREKEWDIAIQSKSDKLLLNTLHIITEICVR
jgi:hypothetical protein